MVKYIHDTHKKQRKNIKVCIVDNLNLFWRYIALFLGSADDGLPLDMVLSVVSEEDKQSLDEHKSEFAVRKLIWAQ